TLGIFGGSLIGIFNLKLSWEFFWRSVGTALTTKHLVMGLGKPVMFGFILTSVGCHMGLRTTGGTQGVGLSTTRSVVVASVTILASDFFMTKILLMLFPVNYDHAQAHRRARRTRGREPSRRGADGGGRAGRGRARPLLAGRPPRLRPADPARRELRPLAGHDQDPPRRIGLR